MKRTERNGGQSTSGTGAALELVSRIPALAEAFSKMQVEFQDRLREIESKLKGISGVQNCLESLGKAGAEREKILHGVACEINWKQKCGWPQAARLKSRELKRLARRVRSLAAEIKQVYSTTGTYLDLVGTLALPTPNVRPTGRIVSAEAGIVCDLLDGLGEVAADLQAKAEWFGKAVKDATPAMKREDVLALATYVRDATGGAGKHLRTLAELLTLAYEKHGIREIPTGESLQKLLRRHTRPAPRP